MSRHPTNGEGSTEGLATWEHELLPGDPFIGPKPEAFDALDHWIGGVDGLVTFGRQGLFAHDNTHHALAMAEGAVDSLNADGSFNLDKWHAYRRVFETHVVED